MILEEIRYLLEDLERLEQAVVDRLTDEPTQVRDRLNRQHEVAQLLDHMQAQSREALRLYHAAQAERTDEVRLVGDSGDPLDLFYQQAADTLVYHARYPNEPIDQPDQRYRPKRPTDPNEVLPSLVDTMFSGEEGFGRYFDLNAVYEAYVNLPNVKRLTYLQYLEAFDNFAPGAGGVRRSDKLTEAYFQYIGALAAYLEGFMRKTRPLENLDKVFAGFDSDFDRLWEKDELPNWKRDGGGGENNGKEGAAAQNDADGNGPPPLSTPDAVWCADCEKEFKNQNVYKGHLTGRKHIRAAEQRAARHGGSGTTDAAAAGGGGGAGDGVRAAAHRLKERAVAAREYRVQRLVAAMSTEKEDTRVNVERRQGMTERERQQELENLNNMVMQAPQPMDVDEGEDENDDDKIYNPLKLPLAWDGKPIPFWLYRLHGLGVEFDCEICGHYTYMGRRAFEKHFNESRHIHGLRCLGINNPGLFRDITQIEEALRLWDKIQKEKKRHKTDESSVVQMEDAEGHVMPEKVYYDLQKQGLL
ncbi:splicing factor 3a subunit [Niveomyces insectorum RCEF 264]|uniref:Splicing factor 3a subunit n=1 Tax=Niveomyces insectorum RCEF 264 TaxID=1081102 RepID=A0A167Y6U1_9HYPO|nr:splicing factor 3a subunit [Niveomyces insectorum RCEF 264]